MKNTKIINIFGAPCSGKSTVASSIFAYLKTKGIDCEIVGEFAKELVWQNRIDVFSKPENQFYIAGNQFYRINSLIGKVDVVITDSPILLSSLYNKSSVLGSEYDKFIIRLQKELDGINIFLRNCGEYTSNGRNETKEEAEQLYKKLYNLLISNGFLIYNSNYTKLSDIECYINQELNRIKF